MVSRRSQPGNARLGRHAALLFACSLTLLGCNAKPRAPALEDTAVYQNEREGFRFLVPTGWTQRAKSDAPRGKHATEQMLAQFMGRTGGGTAMLEVSLADLDAAEELGGWLAKPSHSVAKWTSAGKSEEIDVNGVTATRYVLQGERAKAPYTKEVAAFRRGERVYFITAIFTSTDADARVQVRRAVASTMWK